MIEEIDIEEKLKGTPKANGRIFRSKDTYSSKSSNNLKPIYKSSFHSQKATAHSLEHMERESKVTYLLEHDNSVNDYERYDDIDQFKKDAEKIYKQKIGQKMQSKQKENLIKESVINIKPDTKIKDLEKTFKNLNKSFGGHHYFSIAIHRDEGVFIDSKYKLEELEYNSTSLSWYHRRLKKDVTNDVIDYAPNRNIFYNKEDKTWYLDKEFTNKANTNKFQKKHNYHAHVLYTNFEKETGRTAKLDRKDMRELQTIVADSLAMQRGVEFSNAKRQTHWQRKISHDAKRELKLNNNIELARINDLNHEMKLIRLKLKEQEAKREDYAKLEQLKKDLTVQIKNKELSINELKVNLEEKYKTIGYQNKLLNEKDKKLKEYKQKDRDRSLLVDGEISKRIVKVKDGLLKSKEIYIYKNESVEQFIETSKSKEKSLKIQNENLKKENTKLNELVDDLKLHLKENKLEKVLTKDINKISKLHKKDHYLENSNEIERE